MFVDPSGRGKDETAYAVVKVLHGRLFLAAAGGFQGGYDENILRSIFQVAKLHAVPLILAEPNYGGGMFTSLLKGAAGRYYPCKVEDADWSKGQKELRIIDTLEPVLLQHRLVVDQQLIEADYRSVESYGSEGKSYCLFHQLTRITRAKGALAHDDRLEAVAGAVAHWEKQMARNTDKALIDFQSEERDKKLEKFMNHALKGNMPARPWASQVMKRHTEKVWENR